MKEVELDLQEDPRRDQEPQLQMELGSHRELDSPSLQLFLNSCSSDIVFGTLFHTAVQTKLALAGSPPP